MPRPPARPSPSRARRSFWLLLAIAVLALGSLSDALASPPAPATGLRVAASGLLLLASTSLAARVLLVTGRNEQGRRRDDATRAGLPD